MKKWLKRMLYFTVTILLLFCLAVWYVVNPVWGVSPPVLEIEVDSNRLKADVVALADNPDRHYGNVSALDASADYIRKQLEAAGFTVTYQTWKVNDLTYRNILASYGPQDAEHLVVGAHYDVCDRQPGADDNASGVAGVLELARQLKVNNPKLDYCIDLVLYSLEEPPAFRSEAMGSYVHAQTLKKKGIKIKGMVCLEMIGYFSDEPKSQGYPIGLMKLFYPTKGNYISVVGKTGQRGFTRGIKKSMLSASAIDVVSINAPKWIPGIDFSDHQNYWSEGWDAVMITDTSFYRNSNYHQTSDTPDTLDYARMAQVVRGVYEAITNM